MTGPVGIAQNALVQLAGRRPGQLGDEVDGPRALEVGEPVPAVGDQVLREARARRAAGSASCTTALTSSPRSSLGTPMTATSRTAG